MIKLNDSVNFNPFSFEFTENGNSYSLSRVIPRENKDVVSGSNIKYISIFVTNACNLNCPYCYEKNKHKQTMSLECVDKICQVFGSDIRRISFFGGEPLIEKEFIKKAHKKFLTNNPDTFFSVITNALLLNSDFIDFIISSRINQIGVSWDGFGDTSRYGYDAEKADTVLQKIHALKANGINVSVRMTVSETDLSDLIKSFDYLADNDIPFNIEPAFFYDNMDISDNIYSTLLEYYNIIGVKIKKTTDYARLERQLASGMYKYYGCAAGRHAITINTNGDIYDCHRMMENTDNYLGNVFSINAASQINNKKFYKNKCNLRKECKECDFRFICGGGCTYAHSNKYCEIIKAKYKTLLSAIWTENRMHFIE